MTFQTRVGDSHIAQRSSAADSVVPAHDVHAGLIFVGPRADESKLSSTRRLVLLNAKNGQVCAVLE